MFKSGLTVLLLAAVASVQAHYQLTYPQSRGFTEDNEPVAPCGGFNTVNTTRSEFPIKGGFLEINSEHVQYQYSVHLALNSNPGAADFTASNTTVANGTNAFPEQACLQVDLSKVSGAVDGANATLQIVYNAGDSILYQCTDVVLKTTPTSWNTSACYNANGASSSSSSGSASQPSSTSAPSSAGNSLTISATVLALTVAMAAVAQL
ncbi:unnamed protein product [Umbelopsis ramanniana]